jgi:predicted thioesterase
MDPQSHSVSALEPGMNAEVTMVVSENDTASRLGSGLVLVYATPALVALVENASVHALEGFLPPGQTTVGGQIDLRHLAATPVGMRVRAYAELTEVHGRKLVFRVQAWDEVEQIGEGTHIRYIVNVENFIEKVNEKAKL